jgi:hypothetical protein
MPILHCFYAPHTPNITLALWILPHNRGIVEPWFTNLIRSWRPFVTRNVCKLKLCVLSESYTATDAVPPILPACRQLLLPACVFITRDTVHHLRLFFWKICSWTDLFAMRGVGEPRFHCTIFSGFLDFTFFVTDSSWRHHLHTVPADGKNLAKLSNKNGKVKAKVIYTKKHFLKAQEITWTFIPEFKKKFRNYGSTKKIMALVNSVNNQLFTLLKTGTFTSINVICYIYICSFYICQFCVILELLYIGVLKLTEFNTNKLTYMTTRNTE